MFVAFGDAAIVPAPSEIDHISGPLALEEYRSRFPVQGHPDGSEVVWNSTLTAGSADEETALAEVIGGIYRSALNALSDRFAA